MSYKDTPTKEIIVEIKKMEMDYDNIKSKVLSLLNELEEIEKKYLIASNEINKRGVSK